MDFSVAPFSCAFPQRHISQLPPRQRKSHAFLYMFPLCSYLCSTYVYILISTAFLIEHDTISFLLTAVERHCDICGKTLRHMWEDLVTYVERLCDICEKIVRQLSQDGNIYVILLINTVQYYRVTTVKQSCDDRQTILRRS